MRKGIAIVGALVLMLAAAGTSHAVLLSDLLNGGSIIAGDKLFDNWTLVDYTASDSARTFNSANIDVTALNDGGDNPGPGLSFTVSNGELSVTGDGLYAFVDLMFGFQVSVLDPAKLIKDNTLSIVGALVTNSGDNGMFVREEIGAAPGTSGLGAKDVEFSWLDGTGLTADLTDSAVFAGQKDIWVMKNILVWATEANETAELWGFTQRFSQVPAGVPEPGMLSLLALGGIALLRFRRS